MLFSDRLAVYLPLFIFLVGSTALLSTCTAPRIATPNVSPPYWITLVDTAAAATPNTWLAFRRAVDLRRVPSSVPLHLAADTKYWLWVNDSLIAREGGLKWGPTPGDYYVDSLDLAPHLRAGANRIEVLVWYFGKPGFSHAGGPTGGLWLAAPAIGLVSDVDWEAARVTAFARKTADPQPNYRLPESNIRFDARANGYTPGNWAHALVEVPATAWQPAVRTELPPGSSGEGRPLPFWKDFGLRSYRNAPRFPLASTGDTLRLTLPYNAQVTPYFEIEAPAGLQVDIRTDNYRGGGAYNVRTEYVTRAGRQAFETPGWMNGHAVHYHFPPGVTIHDLRFRETGYASEFAGSFTCNDPFYDELWKKARRTLYITMRDTYMDCPDRERAQWWGDVVLELGETFYALDRQSDRLTRKGIRELMRWQRPDSTIYSPVPAGNWNQELPTQMLASVGHYGIWTYFFHTGDTTLLREVYPNVQKYLAVWQTDADGLVIPRKGGWTWGDWGEHKDMPLLFNGWYYLALRGLHQMAAVLGDEPVASATQDKMNRLRAAFNRKYWTGADYRSPDHTGPTDDRGQALAVVSGITPPEYYPAIREVLREQRHASPYMEKYVLEALFTMGYAEDALARMKERFTPMVTSELTTLWEGWEIGSFTYGGGTYNHAWSGGGLTLLSQKVVGIEPLEPGYRRVRIRPQLGNLERAEARIETVRGPLVVEVFRVGGEVRVKYTGPEDMEIELIAE